MALMIVVPAYLLAGNYPSVPVMEKFCKLMPIITLSSYLKPPCNLKIIAQMFTGWIKGD